jgi:glucose-6-phosphate 1-dehydrogenase
MKDQGLIFTIFGGTGNLTYNKLIPAFYQLYKEGRMKDNVSIVALGRREKTSASYRVEFKEFLKKNIKDFDEEVYSRFNVLIHYFQMDFENAEDYKALFHYMNQTDADHNGSGNRIFYLATSPTFFPFISEQLKEKKLLDTGGYTRAVFEKPFGYNLESATEINETISEIFGEPNIYRIDHYLGKEMIQNINMVRFSNQIFSTVWNKDSIDNVQITVKEKVGVEERGGYYDDSGALRDMIQNHILQILALVAMEPPKNFDTDSIRDEKVKVIRNLEINTDLSDYKNLIFGQYEGYKQEVKVDPSSKTETFVAMKCHVNTPRWEGVPFYIRTGKALDGREAEIIIEFKVDTCCSQFDSEAEPNLLVIKIQPEEGVYFRINTKEPRSENKLMTVSMDYCQSCNIFYKSPEAYEKLLLDIMNGDATLFTRWDEVESAWQLVSKLVDDCTDKGKYMTTYAIGSDGPEESHRFLENDGRQWWRLEDLKSDFMLG